MAAYANTCQAPTPTEQYITRTTANALQNGGLARPVRLGESFVVEHGIDYTYRNVWSFARKWLRWWSDNLAASDFGNDLFRVTRNWQLTYQAWYVFGWRCMIEFFDDNAILDFITPYETESAASVDRTIRALRSIPGIPFQFTKLSDNLVNIEIYKK